MSRVLFFGLLLAGLLGVGPGRAHGDPLGTWTVQASPSTNLLQNVVYGNGQFVAVGYGGSVITSPDGVTWTLQNSGTVENLYTLTFGGDLFVAAGNNGTIIVSSDGVVWTGVNSGTRNPLFGSAYGNGQYLVAGGSNVLVSANGLQFTPRFSPVLTRAFLNSVAFGAGRFVGVGAGGYAVWSTDTIQWIRSDTSLGNHFTITYGGGQFVAGGGGFVGFAEAARSPDGMLWDVVPVLTFTSLIDIVYGNGRYLALALYLGAPPPAFPEFTFESRDGLDWTARSLPTPVGIYGMVYADSRFHAVGDAGVVLQSDSFVPAVLDVLGPPGPNGAMIKVSGEIGRPYRLQASSEPEGASWLDLLSFTNPTEPDTIVVDPGATRVPRRFYRAVTP